jgi:hypothetical protein
LAVEPALADAREQVAERRGVAFHELAAAHDFGRRRTSRRSAYASAYSLISSASFGRRSATPESTTDENAVAAGRLAVRDGLGEHRIGRIEQRRA